MESVIAKFNPNQPRDKDGEWSDGIPGSGAAARTLRLRGSDGTVHAEIGGDGGLRLRMPFDGSDEIDAGPQGHVDTIRLDRATTAELGEELDALSQMRDVYIERAQAAWDATRHARPGTPESDAAQDAWFAIGGDGQRIAGGELDGDTGALVYEMRMGNEVTDTDFLIAIRPSGADPETWDLHEAAGNAAGQYLSMAAFRRLREFLGSEPVSASVLPTRGGGMAELHGVELARPGTWRLSSGMREFTAAMLRDAADFYASTGGQRIPLGFGHMDSRFDGEPAFGWLSNVRYDEDETGPVLLGDLVDMDDWVAAAAPTRWPHRSIEGVMGVTFNGREFGLVLTRLALLGSTPPGIPVLKSLTDVRQLVAASVAATGGVWIAASVPESSPELGATPPGEIDPSNREGAAGMPDAAKLREALGLSPDVSDDEVRAALASAGLVASQPEPPKPAPEPTPAPQPTPDPAPSPDRQPDLVTAAAAQPGTLVIASSVWEETQKRIQNLTSFVDKTKRDERDTVIAKAVEDGKFTPAQKTHFARLWDADPDGTRNLIDHLQRNSALAVAASGYDADGADANPEYAGLYGTNTKVG
jgi:hypothetical protein